MRRIPASIVVPDQRDYMNRIRRNGGARDLLAPAGVALIGRRGSVTFLKAMGLKLLAGDEFVALKPRTPGEQAVFRSAGLID